MGGFRFYRSLLRDRERRIIEIEKEELEKRENEVIPDIIGVFQNKYI